MGSFFFKQPNVCVLVRSRHGQFWQTSLREHILFICDLYNLLLQYVERRSNIWKSKIGCPIEIDIILSIPRFKVVWVTALLPYVVLIILGARALFLSGSIKGLEYYLTPNMTYLKNPMVHTSIFKQDLHS